MCLPYLISPSHRLNTHVHLRKGFTTLHDTHFAVCLLLSGILGTTGSKWVNRQYTACRLLQPRIGLIGESGEEEVRSRLLGSGAVTLVRDFVSGPNFDFGLGLLYTDIVLPL